MWELAASWLKSGIDGINEPISDNWRIISLKYYTIYWQSKMQSVSNIKMSLINQLQSVILWRDSLHKRINKQNKIIEVKVLKLLSAWYIC